MQGLFIRPAEECGLSVTKLIDLSSKFLCLILDFRLLTFNQRLINKMNYG